MLIKDFVGGVRVRLGELAVELFESMNCLIAGSNRDLRTIRTQCNLGSWYIFHHPW
jgi:hypothetical protein